MNPPEASRSAHEEGLADFVVPARRERVRQSVGNPRLRAKLGHRLAHRYDDFDPRYATRMTSHGRHPDHVRMVDRMLTDLGAPKECLVFAPGHELDGQFIGLEAALDEFLGIGQAVLSCIPGRLALYSGEDDWPVLLLDRTGSVGAGGSGE